MAGLTISRTPVMHVTNERRWEAGCAGKDRYPSQSAATAALAHIKRAGTIRKACWLEIYECESCNDWHIGNCN